MELLFSLLLEPFVLAGTLVGLAGAALIHWFAPAPEPLVVEGALIAFGFIVGIGLTLLSGRKPWDPKP